MVQHQTLTCRVLEYDSVDDLIAETPFGSVRLDESETVIGHFAPFEYFETDEQMGTQVGTIELPVYQEPERVHIPTGELALGDNLETHTPYLVNGTHLFTILSFDYLAPNAVGGSNEKIQKTARICPTEVQNSRSNPELDERTVLVETLEEVVQSETVESVLTLHL